MLTTVAMLLLGMSDATPQATTPCQRLAPQLQMRQQPLRRGETGPASWRVNMMGGIGAALFGGSFNASFQLEPLDPTDTRDLNRMCTAEKGNMLCHLEGPVRFRTSTKAGEATLDLAQGERAQVGVEGRHMVCRDG